MANINRPKLYSTYTNIKTRCENMNVPFYKNYGWRWIKILWENYKEFYKDMWDSYKEWLTIDRINNNWNYCKENCRWATKKEQSNNTRRNRYIKYNWETMTLSQWGVKLWIKSSTLRQRFYVYKWNIEKCFTF